MKQPYKFLKIIALLQQYGYVIVEKKPVNKRGNWASRSLFIIKPIT